MIYTVVTFLASLALSVVSSLVLAEGLDRIGERLGLSEGLLGIVTALGADAPEISAAVTALQGGRAALGYGVVLGSNVFNIAALLGLSALVAGKVRIHRRGLVLNGGVALVATAIVAALVLGLLAPVPAVLVLAVVLVPYVALLSLRPAGMAGLGSRGPVWAVLVSGVADVDRDLRRGATPPRATGHDVLATVPALVAVVLASVGLVRTSVELAGRWDVSQVLLGTVVLASLTGIPNVIAAIRLALRRRGSAVVSEAFNSNTINLVAGIAVPALVVGTTSATGLTVLSVWWLLGSSILSLVLTGSRGGLRRWEGAAVVAAYLAFVAVLVLAPG